MQLHYLLDVVVVSDVMMSNSRCPW